MKDKAVNRQIQELDMAIKRTKMKTAFILSPTTIRMIADHLGVPFQNDLPYKGHILRC